MSKVVVMDHPLIQHKIGVIRRKETGSRDFRAMIGEIASLITYEATKGSEASGRGDRDADLQDDGKGAGRKEDGHRADSARGPGYGRRNAGHDPFGEGGPYRSVPQRGDAGAGGVLLQASGGLQRARCVRGGSHAGDGRFRCGGHPDAEGARA